jgi:hypothetical protein
MGSSQSSDSVDRKHSNQSKPESNPESNPESKTESKTETKRAKKNLQTDNMDEVSLKSLQICKIAISNRKEVLSVNR